MLYLIKYNFRRFISNQSSTKNEGKIPFFTRSIFSENKAGRKKQKYQTKLSRDSFQSEQKGNKTRLCIRTRGIRDSCQAWDY